MLLRDPGHGFLCLVLPRETAFGSQSYPEMFPGFFRIAGLVIGHSKVEIDDRTYGISYMCLIQPLNSLIDFASSVINPTEGT